MANSDVDGGTLSVGGFGSTVLEAAEAHYSVLLPALERHGQMAIEETIRALARSPTRRRLGAQRLQSGPRRILRSLGYRRRPTDPHDQRLLHLTPVPSMDPPLDRGAIADL
jgi:hypothetical protein